MIPLSVPKLDGDEWKFVKKCIDSNWISSAGKFVEKFEEAICKYTKAKHAIACINGTSGLFIALKLAGVRSGDEVIVPTLTFIAPINAVKYLGAEPVFMDCDEFMNIDPDKISEFLKEECSITKKGVINKRSGKYIRAMLPVHIFGNPCDMERIMVIGKKYNLKVIEDATESLGSYYKEGKYKNRFTGTIGDFGVYSFNGNKIITTGAGGMIVANNKNIAAKAKYLTNQAKDDSVRYIHNEIGYNFRLTNLQAALGVAQLKQLNKFIKTKKRNYELYKKGLENIKGISLLGFPKRTSSNFWFYSLIVDKEKYGMDRGSLMNELKKRRIQTRPVWHLNHLQRPYIKNRAYKIEKAFWFAERILNVPCSANLKDSDVKKIVSVIKALEGLHGKT